MPAPGSAPVRPFPAVEELEHAARQPTNTTRTPQHEARRWGVLTLARLYGAPRGTSGREDRCGISGSTIPFVKSRWLATVAIAGVVVAHAIDFVLVYGGDVEREHQLASTGHDYWPIAVLIGLVTGLVALGWAIGCGGVRGLADTAMALRARSTVGDITRLATVQVSLFTGLELLERLAAGVDPGAFLRSPECVVGVVMQVVVAAVAIVVLRAVERVSERAVRTAIAPGARRGRRGPRVLPVRWGFPAVAVVAASRPRGPPAISLF